MMEAATRPSTIANTLDDKSGLLPYVASSTLRTIALNPDLMTRLSLVRDDGWRSFKPLFDEAEARGGKREASDGTNIHLVVEAIHRGMNVSAVPEPARSDGLAVHQAILDMGFTIVDTEVFVVTQGLPELCAGTLDLLLRAPSGELFVGDTKSTATLDDGRYNGLKWSVQTAIYNHGRYYNGPTPERDRWGRPRVDRAAVDPWDEPMDTSRALILQVEREQARVVPLWVDTEQGWNIAKLACEIRALRKSQASLILEQAPSLVN